MFILCKDKFSLEELADSFLVLKMNPDGKSFEIVKNRMNNAKGNTHTSMLRHFILSALPLSMICREDEQDEETNRISGEQTSGGN